GEYFVASDVPAILNHTREVIFLDDGEIAVVKSDGYEVMDFAGEKKTKPVSHIDWSPVMAEKSGYKHFMLKEIFEQPRVVVDTFRTRVEPETGKINLTETGISDDLLKSIEKIVIVACGTSYHAALVGKFMIEELARVPVEVDLASEFKYRDPIVNDRTLLILISQSGETADTLAALKEGKAKGAHCFSIVNVVGSSLVRQSDGVLYTHAGPEISVASTKAFTTQLTALYLFGVHLGSVLGRISEDKARELVDDLVHLRGKMEQALKQDGAIQEIAKEFMHANDFLYLGRGINYPIALEGALKLKEISYIHAEGYPAGEMKHGPIALIDENIPVVVLITRNETYDKIMNNIEEVKARSGKVIAVAEKPDDDLLEKADAVIEIPSTNKFLMPIVSAIPMQLIAYHIAVLRGTDVDQPRNLAKSVTVE
ncbi:MAG: glutamine--fructose-6-phosphate transaminase (isomerizing), partial [Deltaproteobacteria bacterium]